MEGEACPMPSNAGRREGDVIVRMLAAKQIAIVGLSDDPERTSNHVGGYLKRAGMWKRCVRRCSALAPKTSSAACQDLKKPREAWRPRKQN